MSKLRINVSSDGVDIINTRTGVLSYAIERSKLAATRDNVYSHWILQLQNKSDMDTVTLYKLAKIIDSTYIDNTIDWYKTFYFVEQCKYQDATHDVSSPEENMVSKIYSRILYNQKGDDEETKQLLDTLVKERLKEYNLLK
jgi:hypothetical protein